MHKFNIRFSVRLAALVCILSFAVWGIAVADFIPSVPTTGNPETNEQWSKSEIGGENGSSIAKEQGRIGTVYPNGAQVVHNIATANTFNSENGFAFEGSRDTATYGDPASPSWVEDKQAFAVKPGEERDWVGLDPSSAEDDRAIDYYLSPEGQPTISE